MNKCVLYRPIVIGGVLLMVFTGCTTTTLDSPTSSPTGITNPSSCDEVGSVCLELSFDGERCTYEGPTEIKTGPVTLIFFNHTEGTGATNLLRHTGDKTIQDAIEYIGEEPSTKHHPSWSVEVQGAYRSVKSGESHFWEGILEPGIYHMVCARLSPIGVWFGTGLTVTD